MTSATHRNEAGALPLLTDLHMNFSVQVLSNMQQTQTGSLPTRQQRLR
jgi:hypothetical protein